MILELISFLSGIVSSSASIGCSVQSDNANTPEPSMTHNPSGNSNSLSPPVYFLFGFITGIIILLMIVIPVGIMIFFKKRRAIQDDMISNQIYGQFKGYAHHSILNNYYY